MRKRQAKKIAAYLISVHRSAKDMNFNIRKTPPNLKSRNNKREIRKMNKIHQEIVKFEREYKSRWQEIQG